MEMLKDINPCSTCKEDRQIGNPYTWQSSCSDCKKKTEWRIKAVKKMEQYEELEEKGYLMVFPLKVGDKVYEPRKDRGFISEYEITMITITGTIYFKWMLLSGIYSNLDGFRIDDIGKTVFLTMEEAEKVMNA